MDHAVKKNQTSGTFARLLQKVHNTLPRIREDNGLDASHPCLLVMDNAPSHTGLDPLPSSSYLHACHDYSDMFVFLTIPNRSHMLNMGDQFVNLTLRRVIRQAAKLRIAQHYIDILDGRLGPDTPVPMGEPTMKPLLVEWTERWLGLESLCGIVKRSWEQAMKLEFPDMPVNDDANVPDVPEEELRDRDSDDESDMEVDLGQVQVFAFLHFLLALVTGGHPISATSC